MEFKIRIAKENCDIEAVQTLWSEYWNLLGLEPDFQGFANELKALPGGYGEPSGRLLIAQVDGRPAGTIALRPLSEQCCEVKRLYVIPAFRGQGVGRALLNQLMADARIIGYRTMYADSLPSMADAQALYRRCGFKHAGPYSATPTPGAMYFELSLT